MSTILVIAGDSIRALLHKRLLLGLMVASVALTIAFSAMFSSQREGMLEAFEATTSEREKMSEEDQRNLRESLEGSAFFFQTLFYYVASFGGSLVALYIFSTAVTSEIRSGTIRITLAKPVSRTQFLLGKYTGALGVMAGYTLIMSGAMLAFTHTQQIELSPGMAFAPWLMFCKQLMMGALAMLLSLFVHPMVAGVVAFFAGNGWCSMRNPLYYVLPSYSDFDLYREVASGVVASASDIAWLTLYAIDFAAVMLLLALWRFRTKEIV
jgi:ABC-type transport system involved in multi-copper enzyme maturation permease subunit